MFDLQRRLDGKRLAGRLNERRSAEKAAIGRSVGFLTIELILTFGRAFGRRGVG